MSSNLWPVIVNGGVAFVVGTLAGYIVWHKMLGAGQRGTSDWRAALPLFSGSLAGAAGLLASLDVLLAPQDRFYSAGDAARILLSMMVGISIVYSGYFVVRSPAGFRQLLLRHVVRFLLELVACLLVTIAGIRFSVMSALPGREIALDSWAIPATVAWMLIAMNVVKLLDGLEGAVSVLLLVAGVAVFYTTLGTPEHFLNGFAFILVGSSLASLRFTAYPARLSLRGPGSACAGFLFAVLTVLARQKTVAALLFVFPITVVLILIGGAVLSGLERLIFPDREEP